MPRHSENPLPYERPSEAVTSLQIEHFPDGGVTIHIPRPKPTTQDLVGIAVALAFGGMFFVLILFTRLPGPIMVFGIMALLAAAPVVIQLKTRNEPPDVIGLSRRSIYVSSSDQFLRRTFEASLASLKDIKIAPRDQEQKGSPPGAIELHFSGRADVVVCTRRSPKEITRIADALKQSWESLTAAEDAPVRLVLDVYLQCCEQNPGADDRTFVQKLTATGIDRSLAARLTLIVPIAFARSVHKDRATFHNYCLVIDDSGKPLRRLRLQDDNVSKLADDLFKRLTSDRPVPDTVKRVAARSPESTAIENRMCNRKDRGLIALPPPRIPQFKSLYER